MEDGITPSVLCHASTVALSENQLPEGIGVQDSPLPSKSDRDLLQQGITELLAGCGDASEQQKLTTELQCLVCAY